ncbi:MAG TPA: hypothetical protein VJU86_11450 [Pyrinomonadaceae bacterium]|nr:hypothetical protein [Pyrinomonadaceae bacterium]
MRKILLALLALFVLGVGAIAQNKTFTRDGLEYAIDLPSPQWRAAVRVDVHQHFEFINGDDSTNGYLRLRKKFVGMGTEADSIFAADEKWELQKLPGYVVCSAGKGVDFTGNLRGKVFSYEFVDGGSAMDGRIYYLQVDNRTFYVLHFTVASKKVQGLREQMDSMARSFRLK